MADANRLFLQIHHEKFMVSLFEQPSINKISCNIQKYYFGVRPTVKL